MGQGFTLNKAQVAVWEKASDQVCLFSQLPEQQKKLRLTPKVVHLKPVFIVLPRTMITGILTPYFFSFPSDNILLIYAIGDT